MANKYLDDAGLGRVWDKIKTWLASWKIEQFGAGEISIYKNAHFKVTYLGSTDISIINDDRDDASLKLSGSDFDIKANYSRFRATTAEINFENTPLTNLTFSLPRQCGFEMHMFNGGKVNFDNQMPFDVHGYIIGIKSGALKGARFTINAQQSAANQPVDLDSGYPVIVVWQIYSGA